MVGAMTRDAMIGLLWFGIPIAVAAFTLGLWWGERGRRIAAERWVATGSPDAPVAEMVPAPKEAEDRLIEAGQAFEKETIERGVTALLEDAKARGVRLTEDQARKDVRAMLAGDHTE